tara:strand:+ start:353 stop:562 length:210 start_codon:yes stop_codon:yes gene_type:complete
MNRICIHTHDAVLLMGISQQSAQALFRKIRRNYAKQKHQCITIDEFCEFTGLSPVIVYKEINRMNTYQF